MYMFVQFVFQDKKYDVLQNCYSSIILVPNPNNSFDLLGRCLMTHASVPEEIRKELGISETLIRLSVGLENAEDLVADIEQALAIAVC
jgi:cystathionine beta-lyase/cystathionine gamma-synthase